MSTFGGKIQEIPNISIDRFTGENVESEAYFLSHCHTDHMQGLIERDCNYGFKSQLVGKNKYLYASQISCTILKRMFPLIENNLKVLDLYIPHTICLRDSSFSVTLIPAGHCPGSVMFLFESDKRILYTGDYRINKNDIKKFECFYDNYRKVKVIDKIYLDTTFFLKKFFRFPKRKESLNELCQIIEDWIKRGTAYYINFITSARYGYEYVFKEIFARIGMPIHVCEETFKFYSLIPELDSSVTLDGASTRIHSNCLDWKRTCIYDKTDVIIKTIKVSALRWTQNDLAEGMSEYESGVHYVCYSTHASYEEGVALIRFLKPKEVEKCVEHNDPYVNKEMSDLITQHVNEFKTESTDVKKSTTKLFDTRKPRKILKKDVLDTSGIFDFPESCTVSKVSLELKYNRSQIDIEQNKNKKLENVSSFEVMENCKIESSKPSDDDFLAMFLSDVKTPQNSDALNDAVKLNDIKIDNIVNTSVTKNENMSKHLSDDKEEDDESVLFSIMCTPPESDKIVNETKNTLKATSENSEEVDSVLFSIIFPDSQ